MIRKLLVVALLLPAFQGGRGVTLDAREMPLVEIRFHFPRGGGGTETTIRYVLLDSGIGYSEREESAGDLTNRIGSRRDINRFWLDDGELAGVTKAARALEIPAAADSRHPMVLRGSAFEGRTITADWRAALKGPDLRPLLARLGGMREDLRKHLNESFARDEKEDGTKSP